MKIFNALMAVPNLIAVVLLCGVIADETKSGLIIWMAGMRVKFLL